MPTEVLALPPGTYAAVDGSPSGLSVVTLTVSRPGSTETIGNTITFTTNATVGATFVIERNGTPTATTGVVGTNALTYATAGLTAGDVITCVVTSGVQVVESLGVTLVAAAANATFTRVTTFQSGVTKAHTETYPFSLNLSSIPIGDEVMIAVGFTSNDGRTDFSSATLGGSSMASVAQFTGSPDVDFYAKARFYRIARPDVGGGTMDLILTVTNGGGAGSMVSVAGAVERVQNRTTDIAFAGAKSPNANVNTAANGAVYGLLVLEDKISGPTFTGLTEIGSGLNPVTGTWMHFAKAEDVALANPRTISSTSSTGGGSRGFVTLSID